MRRVLLIAKRDYLQTVLSKAYIIGLVLVPILIGASFLATSLAFRGNAKDQHVAIIDRTGVAASAVIQAAEETSRRAVAKAPGGLNVMPHIVFEQVQPEADQTAQLLSLSDRIRRGELVLVLDISAGALAPGKEDPPVDLVRIYSNSSGVDQVGIAMQSAVNDGLRRVRLSQLGIDPARFPDILRDVPVVSMALVTKDPVSGQIGGAEKRNPLQAVLVPVFLTILLLMVVLLGAAPHLGAVAEDKMQRVFEMLLCSASSFELMMGKVVASLGTSLTSSIFYILGGLAALAGMALFGVAPLHLLPWFFVYLIAEVAMLSAWSVALGSACNTPQDAQSLAFLLILPVMIPMLMLTPVMAQPNGVLATTMSFIPPFTPMVMLLRQSMPGGVPWWEPWVGLIGMIAFAAAVIWAAARIFRIGILSQGKAPKIRELAQWVVRG
ncbi:MAG: ABC transporter permease [Acidobacteriia bacterium]|nr:ABC transporter permease [Terriglobia bacterium]